MIWKDEFFLPFMYATAASMKYADKASQTIAHFIFRVPWKVLF